MPFPPQSILRDRQLNNPNCDEDHKTTAEGPGFPGSHTGPNGADDPNSDLNIHTSSDCSSHYGASVHQGIMRYLEQIVTPYTPQTNQMQGRPLGNLPVA